MRFGVCGFSAKCYCVFGREIKLAGETMGCYLLGILLCCTNDDALATITANLVLQNMNDRTYREFIR